jgi:hypothetical protein
MNGGEAFLFSRVPLIQTSEIEETWISRARLTPDEASAQSPSGSRSSDRAPGTPVPMPQERPKQYGLLGKERSSCPRVGLADDRDAREETGHAGLVEEMPRCRCGKEGNVIRPRNRGQEPEQRRGAEAGAVLGGVQLLVDVVEDML